MDKKKEVDIPWLTIHREKKPAEEPDPDFIIMLEELCRGPQQ